MVAAAGRLKLFFAPWARALQFRRFAVVGVVNTLVDYVLFVGLTKILQLPLDLVWIAKVVSGTVVYRLSQATVPLDPSRPSHHMGNLVHRHSTRDVAPRRRKAIEEPHGRSDLPSRIAVVPRSPVLGRATIEIEDEVAARGGNQLEVAEEDAEIGLQSQLDRLADNEHGRR